MLLHALHVVILLKFIWRFQYILDSEDYAKVMFIFAVILSLPARVHIFLLLMTAVSAVS